MDDKENDPIVEALVGDIAGVLAPVLRDAELRLAALEKATGLPPGRDPAKGARFEDALDGIRAAVTEAVARATAGDGWRRGW